MESIIKLNQVLPWEDEEEPTEDLLENYQINEEFGHGTFGKVYSAIEKKTGNRYAIKKITNLEFGTVELAREITILKHMQCQNILFMKQVIPVFHSSPSAKK